MIIFVHVPNICFLVRESKKGQTKNFKCRVNFSTVLTKGKIGCGMKRPKGAIIETSARNMTL